MELSETAFECHICSARFQRNDHLQRHRLSHSDPRFACADLQCGMRFHRLDAAIRHQKLHQGTGLQKKKRKPRRGILPCPRVAPKRIGRLRPSSDDCNCPVSALIDAAGCHQHVAPTLNSQSTMDQKSAMLIDCSECAAVNMLCNECMSRLSPATGLGENEWGVFRFCLQHFVRIHAQGFPFLHCSSWRMDWEQSGKLFAMAAVGGRECSPYTELSGVYFEMAVDRLEGFKTSIGDVSHLNTFCMGRWNESCHRKLLTLFEVHILLVEYSLWSDHRDLQEWGLKELVNQATTVMPTLSKLVDKMLSCTSWPLWILLEESKRALWCFYCLVVKSGHFLGHPLSTHEIVKSMHLPYPDCLFEAPDEQTWKERNGSDQHNLNRPVLFQEAFYQLMSAEHMCQLVAHETAKYNSHILLCGLLDSYQAGVTIPCNFTTLDAYLKTDMPRFRLRDDMIRALSYWKALFWKDPYDLWHSSRPDYKLNDIMIWAYMEVRLWECSDTHPLATSQRRAAVQVAFDIFSSISLTGFLEVGAKSPFYVQRIVYFCACKLAMAMITWVDNLNHLEVNGDSMPDADRALYGNLVDCLQRLPGISPSISRVDGVSPPPTSHVRETIVRVWILVTGDAKWVDRVSEHT